MFILPKSSIGLTQSLFKFQWYFLENFLKILKFVLNHKIFQTPKANMRKKNKESHFLVSNYTTKQDKAVWHRHETRHSDQRNRQTAHSESPHQPAPSRRAKDTQGKQSLFIRWGWENQGNTCRKVKLDLYFIPFPKVNS